MKKVLALLGCIIAVFVLLQGCATTCNQACTQASKCHDNNEPVRDCVQRCKSEKWSELERDCRHAYCGSYVDDCLY